ncbi:hypothetical protein [Oligoflexus tunisiensis]|uniref:hypothetical protein n=1 Tax=Oligoflexus tunisiensis TaxID=708132 RepID=UPI00114CB908|nr:hypothetical protein [Oligoflexus tunisiensis]
MIRHYLMTLAVLSFTFACGAKSESKSSRNAEEEHGPDGHLEDGFYLMNLECEDRGVHGVYVSGDIYQLAVLNINYDACFGTSLSDSDVLLIGLGDAGSWEEFSAELKLRGTTGSTDGLRTLTMTDGDGTKRVYKKFQLSRDPQKEVTLSRSDIQVTTPANNQRKISFTIHVNGPDRDYEPSVWCVSSTDPNIMYRLDGVGYVKTGRDYAVEGVLNDPGDVTYQNYKFPALCRLRTGLLVPAMNNDTFFFLDIIYGKYFTVE